MFLLVGLNNKPGALFLCNALDVLNHVTEMGMLEKVDIHL